MTTWYLDGLRFTCTRCGNCCTGAPGTVRVSDVEIGALADHLGVDEDRFRRDYTGRLRGGGVSLGEKPNRDCVFWDRREGCTVYPVRPKQCHSWPFWSAVVHSEERWAEEAKGCPGMNRGALHDVARIDALADDDGTSDSSRESSPIASSRLSRDPG